LQLEKRKKQYRKQLLTQLWAIFLLVLFINAILIEGLHRHQDQLEYCKTKVQKHHNGTEIHTAKAICKLCEVTKQQSHFYVLPVPHHQASILIPQSEIIFAYIPQHPVAYIQLAANKGPPSQVA